MKQWEEEYAAMNKTQTSVDAISQQLTTAMDALPAMTERKKKIEMHISMVGKIMNEIKRRELNNLQDWEDEVMQNSEKLATQTKADLLKYLGREISSKEDFNDKLRALVILVQCSDEIDLINEAIKTVKEAHQNEHFDPQTERFLEVML